MAKRLREKVTANRPLTSTANFWTSNLAKIRFLILTHCIYLPIMYFSQQDISSRAEYVIHSKNLGILYNTENVMTERTKCRALIINRYRKKGSHNEKYLSIVSDTVVQLQKKWKMKEFSFFFSFFFFFLFFAIFTTNTFWCQNDWCFTTYLEQQRVIWAKGMK